MSDSTHILPLRTYLGVFVGLLALTALTTWVAFQDLEELTPVVAMTIATAKMLLVVLYFMHLRYSERLIWVFALAGILWLAILVALLLGDYSTRPGFPGWGG